MQSETSWSAEDGPEMSWVVSHTSSSYREVCDRTTYHIPVEVHLDRNAAARVSEPDHDGVDNMANSLWNQYWRQPEASFATGTDEAFSNPVAPCPTTDSDGMDVDSETEVEHHLMDYAGYHRVTDDGSNSSLAKRKRTKQRRHRERNKMKKKMRSMDDPWGDEKECRDM